MAKRPSASAQFDVHVGNCSAKIKVTGDDFTTCFAAGIAASEALKKSLRDASRSAAKATAETK